MSKLDTILLKVASRCNIACDYCYVFSMGDDGWSRMPKTMSSHVIELVISSLSQLHRDQESDFSVVLHGGEPLLPPQPRMQQLLVGLREVLPSSCSISIQTNGTLISDAFLDLCVATQTNLSFSLDGPEEVHDVHRLGFARESTFAATMAGVRRVQNHPNCEDLLTGFLAVINPKSDPAVVYRFFKSVNAPSLNFLLAHGNHSKLPIGKTSSDSTEYGDWLCGLWDEYIRDPNPIPIRTLDDIARLILGGRATKEGMGTTDYSIVVLETDGSISKNDTLKSNYNGADRFDQSWNLATNRLSKIAQTETFQTYLAMQRPASITCRDCDLLGTCGGGMPLFRWRDENGYDNPSVYCGDHKRIIRKVGETLQTATRCEALI